MESRDSELHEALPWAGEGATWATKTPDEILADLRAALEASFNDSTKFGMPVLVYDKLTGKVRAATLDDFLGADREWLLTQPGALVDRLEANEREVRRVQPRVIRNQPKSCPVRAFRRPW